MSDRDSTKCNLCDYIPSRFGSRTSLFIHKESVHFGIRYPCPSCEILATTKSNLVKHVQMEHKELQSQQVRIKKVQTRWFESCSKEEDHCQCCKQSQDQSKTC